MEREFPCDQYSLIAAKQLVNIDQNEMGGSSNLLAGARLPWSPSCLQIAERISMTPIVQVGTVLIGEESPLMAEVLALQSEPYFANWSVVKAPDGITLDEKIRAARWNFFFLADEIKSTFFGTIGAIKIQRALQRIARKVKPQEFNCLEVTGIVAKRFLGMRYATVFAHSRHIQQGFRLDNIESRRNRRRDAEWARG